MTDSKTPSSHLSQSDKISVTEGAEARAGFVLIAAGKVWFMLCAAILNLGLPRVFADPSAFGDYATINTAVSILNMVIVTAALQSAAKWVSESPAAAGRVRQMALRLQSVVALFVALIGLLSAEWFCQVLFRDESLATYWRIALMVTVCYCLYATCIGVLNGLKRFGQQALFDAIFATLKVSFILGFVAWGLGVTGAFLGFGAAALLVMLGSLWVTRHIARRELEEAPVNLRRLATFTAQSMGFIFFVNVLLQGDVILLKAAMLDGVTQALASSQSPDWVETITQGRALDGASSRDVTSALVGLYRAVKNLTLLPYQAVIAITLVVFPLISRSTASRDEAATRIYSAQALRVSWLLVLAMVTVLGAGGQELITTIFGSVYGLAAAALIPMAVGAACLALTYLMGSMLVAADRARDAMMLLAAVSVGQMMALHMAMSHSEPGPRGLETASYVICAFGVLGLGLAGLITTLRLRVVPPWLALGRGVVACGVALISVSWLDFGSILTIFVRPGIAAVVFVLVCIVSRELTPRDLSLIRSTLSGRTS